MILNRPYCGPFALSFLTGCPVRQMEEEILWYRKDRTPNGRVKGITDDELMYILTRYGFWFREEPTTNNQDFHTWYKYSHIYTHISDTYLLLVPGHCFVVCQGFFIDNHYPDGVPVDEAEIMKLRRGWLVKREEQLS